MQEPALFRPREHRQAQKGGQRLAQGGYSHGPDAKRCSERGQTKKITSRGLEACVSNRNTQRSRPSKAAVLWQSGTTRERARALKGETKTPVASGAASRTAQPPVSAVQCPS